MPAAVEVDDVRFGNLSVGWPEFVQAYRIAPLEQVEFRHLGFHRFTVRIYEVDGLHRGYSAWVDGAAVE